MAFYLSLAKSSVQCMSLARPWKFTGLRCITPSHPKSYSSSSILAPTATSSSTLLGPPQIYLFRPKTDHDIVPPPPSPSHPFVDAMVSSFNSTTIPNAPPMMGYTENNSPTYLSTGNPCLDFFFHVVPDTPPESITRRLQLSWDHDPLKTLKLICNLRGVRGTGKSDREGYYVCALWLHENHPKTLACNVPYLAKFGYFKDLPEILYRLLEGVDVRVKEKAEHKKRKPWKRYGRWITARTKRSDDDSSDAEKNASREKRIMEEMKRVEMVKLNASKLRKEKRVMMATKAVERYNSDPDYKLLHESVSDLFSEHMRSDMKNLALGRLRKISLAAKWCPSINSSFDKSTLICESIAKKVFPREEYPEYEGVEEEHYAYRVRDRLRKQVLVPLRKALELPECFISKNEWDLVRYNRVASLAMQLYKERFLEHDEWRFKEFLDDVRSGKAKIASGALLPHHIISSVKHGDDDQVAELQWKRMVDDMAKKGKLNNCLAICDVSGSMEGTPMEVSVALGLLVSELSEEPWKGKLITFSENPELHMVEGDDLSSKIKFVENMQWDMNTDFQKVFDLILEVATNARLTENEMIKRVFVFSDMEFDEASQNPWETDYQAIQRKFTEKGYGGAVPEIVFWNLRDSQSTPVPGKQKGVALVSGFSKNILKLFIKDGGDINPEDVMEKAISGKEYEKLVVVD
uniref:uncharacterized protein LOC122599502 n=1 Tax=Erigeron canadensis TaxID=72917 RepID=UPI001CB8C382|nr:uncharacterized protein LOC122599502 [Erigeron canadensis]